MTTPNITSARILAESLRTLGLDGSADMMDALADEMERLRAQVEDLAAAARRVSWKFGHDEAGTPSDWSEWADLRAAIGAVAAPAQQAEPLMLNGLTAAETSATASVAGMVGERAEPAAIWYSPALGDFVTSDPGEPGFVRYVQAPSLTVGDEAEAWVVWSGDGNCIIWTIDRELAADAAASYGRRLTPWHAAPMPQPAAQAEPVAWLVDGIPDYPAQTYMLRETADYWAANTPGLSVTPLYAAPPSNPPAQGVGDEREAFEAWADPYEYDLSQYLMPGEVVYVDSDTQAAWMAWQQRAALAQAPTAKEQQ